MAKVEFKPKSISQQLSNEIINDALVTFTHVMEMAQRGELGRRAELRRWEKRTAERCEDAFAHVDAAIDRYRILLKKNETQTEE